MDDVHRSAPLEVTASLRASGEEFEAVVRFDLSGGLTAHDSGIPGFIVQLDAPPGVELIGERVLEFEALRDNEFLMEPWERLVEGEELVLPLRFSAPGKTLGINVVGYVATSPGEDDTFVRMRLELPLTEGATTHIGDSSQSSWGPLENERLGPPTLQIGDPMPAISLPRLASDEPWSTESLLGTSPFLLVTYRGHW